MRNRRHTIFRRILIKANSVLYRAIGKCVDFLERIGIWGKAKYAVEDHYGDVVRITHEYPKNFHAKDKALFDEWKSYDTFPHDLFLVQNSWLTSDGIVLQNHRTLIKTLPHPVFRYQFGILYNLKTRLFYKKAKAGAGKKYILFFDNWSGNNYFHWIIDSLCRAELAREHLTNDFTVILPETSPKYLTETLRLFGYSDFEYMKPRSRVRLNNLYSMNYAAWSGQQHPEILQRMTQTVKAKLNIPHSAPSRKIYVSRGKQLSRRVTNEEEVIAILKKHGFEIVYFEGMSFREQVEIMNSASHLVTSHGANMTNLVFMQKGAKILELINDRRPNFCYWSVASSMGHDYYYQLCAIATADHICVDSKELEKNIGNYVVKG